jgi:uncharacterized protein YceH (UPF0502 family)
VETSSATLTLDAAEIRILGALLEKQITTPEYYPLTLNALVNACNQTTNRDPVTTLDEGTVARTLEGLREKSLVWVVRGGRAPKYEHRLAEKLALGAPETAVMCVLMLRGPQTPGEIRGRTGRLHAFAGIDEVEATLEGLMRTAPPLVTRLPRLPGTKEARFAHLLGGEPAAEITASSPRSEPAEPAAHPEGERIARLEREIEALREEVELLRGQVAELRGRFE